MRSVLLWVAPCATLVSSAHIQPLKRAACNADNCLRAVRASAKPTIMGTSDCSRLLVVTVTPATSTTTFTSSTTITPSTLTTTISTSLTTVTSTVPSTTTIQTQSVSTLSTDTTTTVTSSTTTITTPLTQPALAKRQQTVSPSSIPSYATSACGNFDRYSSACSCVGVVASTETVAAPLTSTTITTTLMAATSTAVTTSVTQSVITTTVTSGVVTVTQTTSTSTSTVYTSTVTQSQTATATAYTFALKAIYPGSVNLPQYFQSQPVGDTYGFFYRQSSTAGQTILVLDPGNMHVLSNNGFDKGRPTVHTPGSTGGNDFATDASKPPLPPLVCSISTTNQFTCMYGTGQARFGICFDQILYVDKLGESTGNPGNCNSGYTQITLQAIPA